MHKTSFLIGLLCLWALSACQFPTEASRVVSIQFGASGGRTVAADFADQATSYQITLTSHNGLDDRTQTASGQGTVHFTEVPAGTWDVSVTALNGMLPIAAGSFADLVVSAQGGASASVQLTADRAGNGAYRLNLRVPASTGVTQVEAQLYSLSGGAAGSPQDEDFTADGTDSTATLQASAIPGGVYRLAFTLYRDDTVVGRFSEAVNIWTNVTSDQWLGPDGTLHSERTFAEADLASSSPLLSNLTVTGLFSLTPGFTSVTGSYTVAAPAGSEFSLQAAQALDGQTIEVQVGSGSKTALPSGTATPFTVTGEQTISVWVTAPDSSSTKVYTISVEQPGVYYANTAADSGQPPLSGQVYEEGDTITVLGNSGGMTRVGHAFAGWNTKADGTGTTVVKEVELTKGAADVVLYPLWFENQFSFTNSADNPLNYVRLTKISDATGHVTVPNGTTSLEGWVVRDNFDITRATFPSTLLSIEGSAFVNCPQLTQVDLPSSLSYIGGLAFTSCGFTTIFIPATVLEIGFYPFHSSSLTAFTVDTSNPNYKAVDGVLYNKSGTELIAVPSTITGTYWVADGVTRINDFAFCGSAAEEVGLPDSVAQIATYAFRSAISVETITVSSGNPTFSSVGGLLYNKAATKLVKVLDTYTGVLDLPDGVLEVGADAAVSIDGITSVSLPSSLTTIQSHGLSNLNQVHSITIPAAVTSIGYAAFASCYGLTSVTFEGAPALGGGLFQFCYNLSEMTLLSTTPPALQAASGTFEGGSSSLVIRVPAEAVSTYRQAQGWSEYADRIEAISP